MTATLFSSTNSGASRSVRKGVPNCQRGWLNMTQLPCGAAGRLQSLGQVAQM